MSIDAVIKQEITRLARKVVKQEADPIRKLITAQRKMLAQLRADLVALERQVRQAQKAKPMQVTSSISERAPRFSAALAQKRRAKLKLSQREFGLLIGVSAQTVYNYEQGHSSPEGGHLMAFQATGKLGRREALAKIADAQ